MAVVINEFEVMASEADAGQGVEPSSAGDAGEKPSPSAHDLELVLEQKLARFERVWAH